MSSPRNRGTQRAFSRLLLFIAPVALWSLCREIARSVRDTALRSVHTVRAARAGSRVGHADWDTTVAILGVTPERIAREVRRRQSMACVAALFVLIGLYGAFAWSAVLPGIGCAALAAIYYLQAALRLYQIRHHEFVSVREYLARARGHGRELLPLGLPRGWTLYVRRVR